MLSGKSTELDALLLGHTESVSSLAFAPDGQRLASCSSDRTIRIWDVLSKEEYRGKPDPLDWFFLSVAHKALGQAEKGTKYATTLQGWLEEQTLKRNLRQTTDPAFTKTLEHELKLLLNEDHQPVEGP